MSREVKRVPLDFDWPLDKVWDGYLSPYHFPPCPTCGPASRRGGSDYGDGLTGEARAIAETFYPHQIGGPRADELAWCDKLGQASWPKADSANGIRPLGSTTPSRALPPT